MVFGNLGFGNLVLIRVNVPVVFRMKIKISKSRLSLLISGIICLNLLKNKIFQIEIWSLASENT
jgi:hypothetical protein